MTEFGENPNPIKHLPEKPLEAKGASSNTIRLPGLASKVLEIARKQKNLERIDEIRKNLDAQGTKEVENDETSILESQKKAFLIWKWYINNKFLNPEYKDMGSIIESIDSHIGDIKIILEKLENITIAESFRQSLLKFFDLIKQFRGECQKVLKKEQHFIKKFLPKDRTKVINLYKEIGKEIEQITTSYS